MKKLIILFTLIPNLVFANCDEPVKYLTEGSKTTCDGYLFSPEQELFVRQKVEQYDNLEKLSKKQDEMINTLFDRLDFSQQNVRTLKNELDNLNNEETLKYFMYFCLGIISTVTIEKALK